MLTDTSWVPDIIAQLQASDFSLHKHQLIFARAKQLAERNEALQRGTVAMELNTHKELETVGGISYLLTLDDDMPKVLMLQHYLSAIREKAQLRNLFLLAQSTQERALAASDPASEIRQSFVDQSAEIVQPIAGDELKSISQIIESTGLSKILANEKVEIPTGFHLIDVMLRGLHRGELVLLAARPSMGKTALAMNMAVNAAVRGAQDCGLLT